MKRTAVFLTALTLVIAAGALRAQQPPGGPVTLAPTNHPRLPRDLTQLWLVPESRPAGRTTVQRELAQAVKLEVDGSFAKALPLLSQPAMKQGTLGHYAEYYAGLAQLRLGRLDEACKAFQALQARVPIGFLAEATLLREAECHEALGDRAASLALYERLSKLNTAAPDEVLFRLGRAAKLTGNSDKASQAFGRLYFELPLSDYAASAGTELNSGLTATSSARYALRLGRAERVFAAKRYTQARSEFDLLRAAATGNDRELAELRVAECDYFLKRPRDAKAALGPYLDRSSRQAEALFFHALSSRALNEIEEYVKTIRQIADQFPTESWTDDGLSDLASYYVVTDQDELADQVFRTLYERFPTGHNAEQAAWKIGWTSYRKGSFAEAARVFERAASDFPRSDYRPMWLYWSGRAHEALAEPSVATARYTLEVTDYANTYHGRLAAKRLAELGVRVAERPLVIEVSGPGAGDVPPGERPLPARVPLPANAPIIRALLELDLFDQAVDELRWAQRISGNSSAIEATLSWTYWQQGRSATGSAQFALYRGAINAMKRAYPHYLAAGGEALPREILKLIFPIAYWDTIREYADQYNVDPYLTAALVAQESTFVADIKSYANAWGLTQLMPPTARQYAKTLKMAYTPKVLTDPDANLRIGMAYFAAKIKEFGQVHLALASYNAGERPVHRWMNERPGLPQDEFIDDIPYPQTNNYVKKLLSTAEDYRRLYGPGSHDETLVADASPAVPAPAAATAPAPAASAAPAGQTKTAPASSAKKPAPKTKKRRKAA